MIGLALVVSDAGAATPDEPWDGRYPANGAVVFTTTPTLAAVFRDSDLAAAAGQGWIDFQVFGTFNYEDGGGTYEGLTAYGRGSVTSNGGFSRWTIPANSLSTGVSHRWRARAYDGSSYSAWTTDERFLWVSAGGTRGDGASAQPSSSGDGQTVAFVSGASNLVPGDRNNLSDIFVRDDVFGLTTRVTGRQGEPDGPSWEPSVSDDGRYVAFSSAATNLVPEDTNGATDVFVADLDTGDVIRASVNADGSEIPAAMCYDDGGGLGGGVGDLYYYLCGTPGYAPSITGDGRHVAFVSEVAGVAAGASNGTPDVYVFDRITRRTIERVSASTTAGPGGGTHPSISNDGGKVAFDSWQPITSSDTNGRSDVFVRDRTDGLTRRASISPTGVQGNGDSSEATISGNGSYVAFSSTASSLLERDSHGVLDADTNGQSDVFRADLQTGSLVRVSGSAQQWEPNGRATAPTISDDGARLAFASTSSNHGSAPCTNAGEVCDSNGVQDVFEWKSSYSHPSLSLTRVSFDDRYGELDTPSDDPSISGDGKATIFATASGVAAGLSAGTAARSLGVYRHLYTSYGCVLSGVSLGVPPDTTPPAPASEIASEVYSSGTRRLIIGWAPGVDPEEDSDVSGWGIAREEVRYQRPGSDYTQWAASDEQRITLENVAGADTINVQVRTIDVQGNVSAVATSAVTPQPTQGPPDDPVVTAPVGPGTGTLRVRVDPYVDDQHGPLPTSGYRVEVARPDGTVLIDDTDADGVAEFSGLTPGEYTVRRAGTSDNPDIQRSQPATVIAAGQSREVHVALEALLEVCRRLPHLERFCDDISLQEVEFCLGNGGTRLPLCLRFYNDANAAMAMENTLFDVAGVNPESTKANAFRHAYWVARMVRTVYRTTVFDIESDAIGFANAREAGNPSERKVRAMDDHNNRVGYNFARKAAHDHNTTYLCNKVLQRTRAGRRGEGATANQLYWLSRRARDWTTGDMVNWVHQIRSTCPPQ